MPKLKLDDRTIRTLTSNGRPREDYADLLMPGLHLRVTDKGAKTWSIVFRIKGQAAQLRKTYGALRLVSLAKAREMAREDLGRAARGEDPRVKSTPVALTFEALADLWLAHLKAHNRSWMQDVYRVRKDLLPRWQGRTAENITKADIIGLRDDVHGRGATVAEKTVGAVSRLYNWALKEDLVQANPAYRVSIPSGQKVGRRWLDDGELRTVLQALLRERRQIFAAVLLARALLGQRTGETLQLEWTDTADGWWDLPGTITKNGQPHRVPLIPLFRELVLDRLRPVTGEGRYVFASRRREGPVHEVAVTCYANEFNQRAGVDFDPRDLRRTYVTHLARMGVARETRQRLVNHRGGFDVVDIHYDVYDYDAEKLAAALRWDAHLRTLLYGEALAPVVPLRA